MNNLPTYFYEKDYLSYISERFGYDDYSYNNITEDYTFYAPILASGNKVEACNLSYLPLPTVIGKISIKSLKKEMNNYLLKLNELASERIALRQDPLVDYDNQIIKSILACGFSPQVFYTTIVDLTLDENILWKNIRSSYHSLINKLEKDNNLSFIKVNSFSVDKYFNDWKDLYSKLLERGNALNRNLSAFDFLYKSICNNTSYLYLVYENNKLLSGVHVTFANKKAYYFASGTAIEVEGMNFYSHYLLWNTIKDLKSDGFSAFEIGPVFYNNVANFYKHSEKELAISDFKLGIGGELTSYFIFEKLNNH